MFRGFTAPPTGPDLHTTTSEPRAPRRALRRTGTGGLAALMALGTIPGITAMSTVATAAVSVGSNISVFPDRDFVGAMGYNLGEQLLIEVVRNGVVIGTTQGAAMETPEGNGLEVNHGAEGTPQPGECWNNYTPDIIGGDLIRVTALDRVGTPVDTTTVADVAFSGRPYLDANNNVAVDGVGTAPLGDIAVEFRRDKPDPRFRGGPFVPVANASGGWTATYRVGSVATTLTPDQQRDILLNDAAWLAVVDKVTETTLAELGEPGGVAAGCTGSADPNTLVGGLDPINITSGDVTFSGTARAEVAAVTVKIGTLEAKAATVTPNGTNPSTWTLTVPKSELATLPEGSVTVTPTFDTLVGTSRTILKDTVAPLAPTPSVPPGTYSSTQSVALNKPADEGTSKVYWEIGNSNVPDPDHQSNLYTAQINVTSTQTIKGRLIDAAGNLGTVGSFTYQIGTPPAAPTNLSGTEVAPAGSARLTWTGVAGVTGYNLYRSNQVQENVKLNATPLTVTSFTDQAGLGEHTYVVRSVEANGIESLNSNTATVTVAAPDVPADLRTTGGDGRVTLNWTTVTGASGYRIYRDGALVTTVSGTTSSYTNTGLTNTVPYDFQITSVDASGNESARSLVVQGTPADTTPPPAPTFSLDNGTYNTAQTVTIADAEAGAVIRYTVGDGTTVPADPTVGDTQYTGAITVGSSQVIKAAAFDAANNRSPITQRTYTIDAGAPTVTAQSPTADATGVAVGSNVTATFSEAVQGVTTTTFALRPTSTPTAPPITATVTRNGTTNEWILNPGADLAFSTSYTATLTNGIRDLAGNAVNATSWSFTTAAAPTPVDGTAPTVSSRNPAASATGVAVGSNVTATFSEAVQGVSGTTFFLRASGSTTNIPATVSYDATNRVATLDPGSNLTAGTTYTATLTGGSTAIRDSANNALATTSWSFTTAAATSTGGTRTVTVTATEDTYVRQAAPSTVMGSSTAVWANATSTTTRETAYLKYNIPALATGESITAAALSFNVTGSSTNGPTIYRTATTWSEGTLTWNSADPARSGGAVANIGNIGTGRQNVPVTGVTAAGLVSFELFADSGDSFGFSSSEATTTSTRPTLVLTIRTP